MISHEQNNILNEAINNYEHYFHLYKDLLSNYEFEQGEEVTLQHRSWDAPRTMIVTVPGTQPTLEVGPIVIKFPPAQLRDFLFILPYNIIEQVDAKIKDYKRERNPKKSYKQRVISEKKYWAILNEFTDPGDGGDPFENDYTFEMALTIYDSFHEVIDFIIKRESEWDPYSGWNRPKKNDIVQRIQWDLESLL